MSDDNPRNVDSLGNIFGVAIAMCLVCSVIVAGTAVALKPQQDANKVLDRKQNVLRAAGMLPPDRNVDAQGRGVEELFAQFEVKAVNLDTGEYVDGVDTATFDPVRAAGDTEQSLDLTGDQDIATIGRRENVSLVYLKESEGGEIESLVLPIRGYGLWGTLFGYLALDGNLQSIEGIGFYSHKETPGLGGEVDNSKWKASWNGVELMDDDGMPAVSLVKTRSPAGSPAAAYEVDALSGATFTTRGVEDMVRFWTGELGFGPYLSNLKAGA